MKREERVIYVIYAHQPQAQSPVVGLLAAMGQPLHFAELARSAKSDAPWVQSNISHITRVLGQQDL